MPRMESSIHAPRSTGLVRYGCDETANTAGIPNNPPRFDPGGNSTHWGCFRAFVLMGRSTSEVFGEVTRPDGVLGVEEIQQRHVPKHQLAKEHDRLVADVAPQLFVTAVGREQLASGVLLPLSVARVQPLPGEPLREEDRVVVSQHSADELFEDFGILEFAGFGEVEEKFVRHAAPEKIREPRSHRILIERPGLRAGIRRLPGTENGAKPKRRAGRKRWMRQTAASVSGPPGTAPDRARCPPH